MRTALGSMLTLGFGLVACGGSQFVVAPGDAGLPTDGSTLREPDATTPESGETCGANLQTDPSNCGACGHACVEGATCTNGLCPVTTLAAGLTNPHDLALGDALYVTVDDLCDAGAKGCPNGEVIRISTTTEHFTNEFNPKGIVADPAAAFWADDDPNNGTIRAFTTTSSGPTSLGMLSEGPIVLALTATQVYWGTSVGTYGSQPRVGGSSTQIYPNGGSGAPTATPTALAVDPLGKRAVWTIGSQANTPLASAPDGLVQTLTFGNQPTTIQKNAADPLGLVLNGGSAIWSEFYGNAIYSAAFDGSAFQTLVSGMTYAKHPVRVALDGDNLYWTTYGSMDDGTGGDAAIFKKDLSSGEITTLATAEATLGIIAPTAIVVGPKYVYWLNRGKADTADGSVMQVSK